MKKQIQEQARIREQHSALDWSMQENITDVQRYMREDLLKELTARYNALYLITGVSA